MQSLEKHINFENENSRKAYYREFKKVCQLFTNWFSSDISWRDSHTVSS